MEVSVDPADVLINGEEDVKYPTWESWLVRVGGALIWLRNEDHGQRSKMYKGSLGGSEC